MLTVEPEDTMPVGGMLLSQVPYRRTRKLAVTSVLLAASLFATYGSARAADECPATDISDLNEPVAVRTWLVAGPIANPALRSDIRSHRWPASRGFNMDFLTALGGEAAARPTSGMVVTGEDGTRAEFQTYTWNTDYVDLTEIYGRPSDCSAYLYAELESKSEQRVYIHFGSNDGAKVWADGALIVSVQKDRPAVPSTNIVPMTVRAGKTPLLVRVDNMGNNWGAYVQISNSPESLSRRSSYPSSNGFGGINQITASQGIRTVERIVWISAIGSAIAVIVIGAIIIAIITLRHRNHRLDEERMYNMRLEMIRQGMAPDIVPTHHTRGAGLIIWGLMLTLGGLALTITEVAGSGFRNAGLELAICFAGIGLLAAHRLIERPSASDEDDTE